MPTIKINNLTVKYKVKKKEEITAINGLNLEIKEGCFYVILGYNGSGKSTLLKAIAGTVDYEGTITFNDVDIQSYPPSKRNLSMVNQQFALYPSMTIFENIAFPLSIIGAKREEIIERVNEVATRLGIEHCLSRKPKMLSMGQQQRACLARALVKKPNLYLFDEPLSNSDPLTRVDSRMLIRKIVKETSSTAIYVTHNLTEAMSLADYIVVMSDGDIICQGLPMDVYNSSCDIIEALKGDQDNETL